MPGITLACNIFNEINAVHGLLETGSQFFDEIYFLHAGPNGAYSTDGTIEVIKKWGARLDFASINDGFGVIRSRLIREAKTEWVMILDADERFHPMVPLLAVDGHEKYPDVVKPNTHSHSPRWIDQGALLRGLMNGPWDVIRTCRRHWFDFTWKNPCQNWHAIADWQARTIRNNGKVGFKPDVKMHEQMVPLTCENIIMWQGNAQGDGPYHDHYHCFFKPMEPEQRKHDIQIYNAIHEGSVVPTSCSVTPP